MAGDGGLREIEDRYEGFTVYDSSGEKIGKVDEIFLDEADREEYIGVKMGLFGLSGTTLVPMELSRVDERGRRIDVSETKDHVKDAPTYRDDDDVDGRFEDSIRRHFNLAEGQGSGGRAAGTDATGAEGAAVGDNTLVGGSDTPDRHSGASMGGAEDRERVGQESYQNREDMGSGSAMGAAGASDAAPSGGIPDLETGPSRASNEDVGGSMTRGHHEEPGERPGGAGDDDHSDRQAAARRGSDPGEHSGAPVGAPGDKEFEDMRGYQGATTGSVGSGQEGDRGGDQGGGAGGDREGAAEHFGAPASGPGDKEFDDMQDYQSATTGFREGRGTTIDEMTDMEEYQSATTGFQPSRDVGSGETRNLEEHQHATTGYHPSEGGETGGGDQTRAEGGPGEEEGGRPRVRRIRR